MPRVSIFTASGAAIIANAAALGLSCQKNADALIGKTAFFQHDKQRMAGIVAAKLADGRYEIKLAIPNGDGILYQTDTLVAVKQDEIEVFKGVITDRKASGFNALAPVQCDKKFVTVTDDQDKSLIVDYRDVTIDGYASTFKDTTPEDRDGEYVLPGAFSESISEFKKNPIMLMDHNNSVKSIAGSFTKIGQDSTGLAIQGKLSNAPHVRECRFLIVEGHLKTLSIGGFLFFGDDRLAIEKVQLFEISLVAVPSNPDAIFTTRALSLDDADRAYKWLAAHKSLKFATAK